MASTGDALKIGALASLCRVSRDTIRFYERAGLLPRPRRTRSHYRLYDNQDADRLLFIRQAQSLGLTLDDIRELVRLDRPRTPGQCRRVAGMLRERIEAIDRKLSELGSFRRRLAQNLELCENADSEACPMVLELAASPMARRGERRGQEAVERGQR